MDTDNKNIHNTISEISTSDIISGILARYNMQETDEEIAKKYFGEKGGEETNGGAIFWVASNLANGKITEKAIIPTLATAYNPKCSRTNRRRN